MTNTFIILDEATGRVAGTQALPDAYAPVLGAGQHATYDAEGQVARGTFTGTGSGTGAARLGTFAVAVWGVFVATLCLEASFDGGTVWIPVVDEDGLTAKLTAPGQIVYTQGEAAVLFRVTCSAFTSGTVNWQIGQ